MKLMIPPGGMAALGQQSAATQYACTKCMTKGRTTGTGKKMRRRAKAARPRKVKRARRASKRGFLVKGSAAAKRYMAKLRRMRGK